MTSSNGNISALLALCVGNSPVTGEFPTQRPVTRSFDVSFDLRLNKRLSKQSWRRWFETPSRSSWRHWNEWIAWTSYWIKYIWPGILSIQIALPLYNDADWFYLTHHILISIRLWHNWYIWVWDSITWNFTDLMWFLSHAPQNVKNI